MPLVGLRKTELITNIRRTKRGIKDNTFENYKYMYNTFVRPPFGKKRIQTLKKSDVKIFYNYLADQRCLQDTLGHQDISTTMNIYTDATKEMKKQEFESLDNYLNKAV